MKRTHKFLSVIAIVLAVVMIGAGVAVYASSNGDAGRKSTEATSKQTPEPASIDEATGETSPESVQDDEAKATAEPEDVSGEGEQLWKLQFDAAPAYIGYVYCQGPETRCYTWEPGIVDQELIDEFVEMLEGMRFTYIPDEEYRANYKQEQRMTYPDYGEHFSFYDASGKKLGDITFSRAYEPMLDENGNRLEVEWAWADKYPEENLGWSNIFLLYDRKYDCGDYDRDSGFYIVDEDTFDQELLERVWRTFFFGADPIEYFNDFENVTAGKNPINLRDLDVIKRYPEKHPGNWSTNIMVVPVD